MPMSESRRSGTSRSRQAIASAAEAATVTRAALCSSRLRTMSTALTRAYRAAARAVRDGSGHTPGMKAIVAWLLLLGVQLVAAAGESGGEKEPPMRTSAASGCVLAPYPAARLPTSLLAIAIVLQRAARRRLRT
jgi:hypothetical protein